VVGDFQDMRRVYAVTGTEASYALEHGCPGNSATEEEVEDAAVDRDVVLLGTIAHIEGDFYGFP
jgi:hypothetical protein